MFVHLTVHSFRHEETKLQVFFYNLKSDSTFKYENEASKHQIKLTIEEVCDLPFLHFVRSEGKSSR